MRLCPLSRDRSRIRFLFIALKFLCSTLIFWSKASLLTPGSLHMDCQTLTLFCSCSGVLWRYHRVMLQEDGKKLIEQLSRSQIYEDYERAFSSATGLPLTLRSVEVWQPAHRGKKH